MGTVTVVFDTNILISALIWGGKPEQCLDIALSSDDVRIIHSGETVAELNRVLDYPKFDSYLTTDDILEFRAAFLSTSKRIEPEIDIEIVDDPDDDMFLELAVAGNGEYVVSGDDALLRLERYDGIRILSADEFLTEMAE